MRASKGVAKNRMWLGAAMLGSLVFGLALAGAEVAKPSRPTNAQPASGSATASVPAASASEQDLSSSVFGSLKSGAVSPLVDRNQLADESDSPNPIRYQKVIAGTKPEGDFPEVAKHRVNYLDDDMTRARKEGQYVGPMPLLNASSTVAAGGCSFSVECDDGIPCTIDTCNRAPEGDLGSGKCVFAPVPAGSTGGTTTLGGCNDQEVCNGLETCESLICRAPASNAGAPCTQNSDCLGGLCYGSCAAGATATCCSVVGSETLCQSAFGTCTPESDNPTDPFTGKPTPCTVDAECRGSGRCERCYKQCATDADCDDGRNCNGKETCDVGTGICERNFSPCGANADCDEGRCLGGSRANQPCSVDSACPGGLCVQKVCANLVTRACAANTDCTAGASCVPLVDPVCYAGRCCNYSATGTGIDDASCLKQPLVGHCQNGSSPAKHCKTSSDCTGGGTCVNTVPQNTAPQICQTSWFPGNTGRHTFQQPQQPPPPECGDSPADLSEPYSCPQYSSGITQLTAAAPPVYPVVVGPISNSPVAIPGPGGPGGALNKLGDDYTFVACNPSNCPDGTHIGLDVLRVVAGPITAVDRILIEFYDASGNFIEDIVLPDQATGNIGLIVVEFEPELVIPPSGFVVLRAAGAFAPNTELVWLSSESVTVGSNDTNKLWVNDGPAANFLSPDPGILAFELVGDRAVQPGGACCDPSSFSCEDNVAPWICAGREHNYDGDSTLCASCAGGVAAGALCRRCSTACTMDSACNIAGVCTTGTCTAGLVGNDCTVNADCNYVGVCFGACAGGAAVNQPCDANADCPGSTCNKAAGRCGCDRDEDCSAGVCGPNGTVCPGSTCELDTTCGNGACCDPTLGTCIVVSGPGSCSGTWSGYGTDCDADNGLDEAEQHCCEQPFLKMCDGGVNDLQRCYVGGDCPGGTCTAQICSAGPNNLKPCSSNAQCRFCVGGGNNGLACTVNGDCPAGECLGTCGTRYTGADNTSDAYVHVISVPSQFDPPVTFTITGDNTGATSSAENPDACWGALPNPNNEPGWFERFTVNDCAWVRVDYCCTNPVHEPAWALMATDDQCTNTIGTTANPYRTGDQFGEVAFFRGEPYCKGGDDNLWMSFGPLAAGVDYYYPVYSAINGHRGEYQLHITVEACPDAACCKGDGSCELLNQVECDAAEGLSLQRPQLSSAVNVCDSLRCNSNSGVKTNQPCSSNADCLDGLNVGTCVNDSNGVCQTGACCSTGGRCEDSFQNRFVTKVVCEDPGAVYTAGGTFTAGARCYGGECDAVPSKSCSTGSCEASPATCCNNLGDCSTDDEKDAQTSPCPVCPFLDADHCQFGSGNVARVSDTSFPTPYRVVDDFSPTTTTTFDQFCVLGAAYLGVANNCYNLGGGITDKFTIRLYDKAPGVHLPGNKLGEWATNVESNRGSPYLLPDWGTFEWHDYSLTLIPTGSNPLVQVQAGETYFVEIGYESVGGDEFCFLYFLDSLAGEGNQIAFQDSCEEAQLVDAAGVDVAYCINVPFQAPAEPLGPCYTGGSPACVPAVPIRECLETGGRWRQDLPVDCSAPATDYSEPNDLCGNGIFVQEGFYSYDLLGTLQDGSDQEQCEHPSPSPMDGDIWYFYQPSASGSAYIGTCSCERDDDPVVAIYTNPGSPTVCPCPGDPGITFLTCNDSGNTTAANFQYPLQGCPANGITGNDHAEIITAVTAGNCYTIRVAAFQGTAPDGDLRIAISPSVCGNELYEPVGGEECDGEDDDLCPGNCNINCQCPPPVCGNGIKETALGEECDTTSGNSTPCSSGLCIAPGLEGECTCIPFCGNNHREGAELCDGTDLGICGAAGCNAFTCRCDTDCGNNMAEVGEQCDGTDDDLCPTRCIPDTHPDPALHCTCPEATCGNDYVETILNNEECDGADLAGDGLCDPADCRAPGDPGGECTCACAEVDVLPIINWNADPLYALRANRSVTISAVAATASGGTGTAAIQFRMIDLQNPVPANAPCCPPQNFSTFESATCTAVGETGSCNRWVGPVQTFFENTLNPGAGNFRGARLQCSPFYFDWTTEGDFSVFGAEIVPSSAYEIRAFGASCKGSEGSCSSVSSPVTVNTRRWGDIGASFSPPAPAGQPDALDVITAVNKFRNLATAASKRVALIKGNSADPNVDVDALDIVAVVDSFRGFRFPFSGPCVCPSTFVCGATACTADGQCSGGTCVKTCSGGANDGLACITAGGCPGGTCGSGACRDRCGRCRP